MAYFKYLIEVKYFQAHSCVFEIWVIYGGGEQTV